MQTGVICNTSKLRTNGFGFIKPDNGGGNVFFHMLGNGNKNVKGLPYGQAVKYTQGVNAKGVYAENIVHIAGFQAELSSSSSRQPSSMEVLAGSGRRGFADGAGAAAQFSYPSGVAVDGEGSIIITDTLNNSVRKVTPDGTVSTLAGSGIDGFADGAGAAAQFDCPCGVAVDGGGSIIIADQGNERVCKITPDGTVSTLAGSGRRGFADGAGAAAQFDNPYGVAVDGEGNIIIADTHNHRVRKLTPDGTVSTLAGSGIAGFADGAGAAAQFDCPEGVAVDGEGSIIIAEFGNKRLRKITPDGTVSTLFAGTCGFRGVAIDADGCVVVCTTGHMVAKIAGCRVAAPGAAEQKRRLAFCMLSHERLGHGSIWAGLEQGLLQMVLCNKH